MERYPNIVDLFFFSSRRRHTIFDCDWSSDVCSSDLDTPLIAALDLPTYAAGQSPDLSTAIHHPQDINVPIGCGGVAVLPGDVIVGDGEGVLVIPRAVAEVVIEAGYEEEQREDFIMSKIRSGSSILGVYPPDERTLQEYAD